MKKLFKLLFPRTTVTITIFTFVMFCLTGNIGDAIYAIIAFFVMCMIPLDIIIYIIKKLFFNNTHIADMSMNSGQEKINEQAENLKFIHDDLDDFAQMCNVYCEFKEKLPTNDPTLNGNFRFNDKRFTGKYSEPHNCIISPNILHSISNIIISTYNNFGVYVKVNNFNFTKYYFVAEITPCPGTSVKSILAFQNEVAIALGTEIIINAMYEKGYVGIIIPMNYIDAINNSTEIIKHVNTSSTNNVTKGRVDDCRDDYFINAGYFIIEKEKASIGMLQRVFKIGFIRAARIMDQLEEAGVVGKGDESNSRKILMSMEDFEQYLEKYFK